MFVGLTASWWGIVGLCAAAGNHQLVDVSVGAWLLFLAAAFTWAVVRSPRPHEPPPLPQARTVGRRRA